MLYVDGLAANCIIFLGCHNQGPVCAGGDLLADRRPQDDASVTGGVIHGPVIAVNQES